MAQPSKMFRADSMGFIGRQGERPDFGATGRPDVDLIHLTCISPKVRQFQQLQMPLIDFRDAALLNPATHFVGSHRALSASCSSIGLIFGLQHAPDDLTYERVRWLAQEGIRIMGIAYDGNTEYGGGFTVPDGLTDRGRKLIGWMAECGILLDLSHANPDTALDALTFITDEGIRAVPLLSHSAAANVHNHGRNAPDEVLQGVTGIGGYAGIPAITFFTGPPGSSYLAQFVKHVQYAARICGANTIGIGSDCNHCSMSIGAARAHFDHMVQMLHSGGRFGEYFPDRPPEVIENGDRMFDIFQDALCSAGIEPNIVDGICGQNFTDYLLRALP